jgi:hypothetical protein
MYAVWLADALYLTKKELKQLFFKFPLIGELRAAILGTRGKRTRWLAVVGKDGQPADIIEVVVRGRKLKLQNNLKSVLLDADKENVQWLVNCLHAEATELIRRGKSTLAERLPDDAVVAASDDDDGGDEAMHEKIEKVKRDKDRASCLEVRVQTSGKLLPSS